MHGPKRANQNEAGPNRYRIGATWRESEILPIDAVHSAFQRLVSPFNAISNRLDDSYSRMRRGTPNGTWSASAKLVLKSLVKDTENRLAAVHGYRTESE